MLSPYTVIDLTNERGLLAGKILADLGANVIQVEPRGGSSARRVGPFFDDGEELERSCFWAAYACNKRGIELDLDDPADQARLRQLVATADFFLESDMPGVMARRGLGYADLAAINPGLIYGSITPFGQEGPKAQYADSDLVVWAAGGSLLPAGGGLLPARDGDRPPVRISAPQSYLHAAADAAAGVLLAHMERVRSGRGQHVDISAQQSVAQATLGGILAESVGHAEPEPKRAGSGGAVQKWRAKDGYLDLALSRYTHHLLLWMYEEGQCTSAELALDWTTLPAQAAAGTFPKDEYERVVGLIAAFVASKTRQELVEAAASRRIMLAPLFTVADLLKSEQLASRDFWRTADNDPSGRLYPGPIVRTNGMEIAYRRPAPRLGEHNSEILGATASGSTIAGRSVQPDASGGGPSLPLAGIKVLDFTWVVAGPITVRGFADFGATVVKVESPSRHDSARLVFPFHDGIPGIDNSALFGDCNAGKFGVTLNVGSPEGREVIHELVRWADVVTDSYTPGVMQRWGLGYEQLKEVNPEIIVFSTSINGQTGPHSAVSGGGNTGAALAGIQDLTGWPDHPPLGPNGPYTDFLGPRFSIPALLAALDHRRRTGKGCFIDNSQTEAGIHYIAPAVLEQQANGRFGGRNGNHDRWMAPNGAYACTPEPGKREAYVALTARTDAEWRALAQLIGGGELAEDARFATLAARIEHEDALDELIGRWTAGRSACEVETLLQANGIPAYVAIDSRDAMEDPQLLSRGHFVTLPHPIHGTTVVEGPRYRLSRTPGALTRCAPTLGRDNDYVFREILGFTSERVEQLRTAGALD